MSRSLVAGMVLALAAAPAAAGDDGGMALYGAVSAGRTEARDGCDEFRRAFPSAGDCDQSATGWRLAVGYRIFDFIGAELEYARFGEVDAVATIGGSKVAARARAEGVGLLIVGNLPLGDRAEAFIKLGQFKWEVEAEQGTASVEADGYDWTFGIGGRYRLMEGIWGWAAWRRYRDVGDRNVTGRSDVDFLGVGLELRAR